MKKLPALVTSLAFFSTTVLPYPALDLIPPAYGTMASPVASILHSEINLPEALGRIEDRFEGTQSGQLVVHIQDAHTSYDAQRSIQQIIDYFEKNYGLGLVAFEGLEGALDPLLFRAFPDRAILGEVLDHYMRLGELSGVDFAAAVNEYESRYVGIEDENIYEAGIALFLAARAKAPETIHRLNRLEDELAAIQRRVYSRELKALSEKWRDYERGGLDLGALLTFLSAYGTPDSSTELGRLIALAREAERAETKLSGPDAKIDGRRLMTELRSWTHEIKEKLFTQNIERRIDDVEEALFLLKDIAGLKASPEELDRYFSDKAAYAPERFRRFFGEMKQNDRITFDIMPAVLFYRNARVRDQILADRLITLTDDKKYSVTAFVSGGFHTPGIVNRLRREGVPYIVVTPKMEDFSNENRYEDVMTGNISYGERFDRNHRGEVNLYKAFAEDVTERMAGRLAGEGKRISGLKRWRDEIIRASVGAGRAAKAHRYTYFIDRAMSEWSRRDTADSGEANNLTGRIASLLRGFSKSWFQSYRKRVKEEFLRAMNALETLHRRSVRPPAPPAGVSDAGRSGIVAGGVHPMGRGIRDDSFRPLRGSLAGLDDMNAIEGRISKPSSQPVFDDQRAANRGFGTPVREKLATTQIVTEINRMEYIQEPFAIYWDEVDDKSTGEKRPALMWSDPLGNAREIDLSVTPRRKRRGTPLDDLLSAPNVIPDEVIDRIMSRLSNEEDAKEAAPGLEGVRLVIDQIQEQVFVEWLGATERIGPDDFIGARKRLDHTIRTLLRGRKAIDPDSGELLSRSHHPALAAVEEAISNAVKALIERAMLDDKKMFHGGLMVRAYRDGSQLVAEVVDDGIGFFFDIRDKIGKQRINRTRARSPFSAKVGHGLARHFQDALRSNVAQIEIHTQSGETARAGGLAGTLAKPQLEEAVILSRSPSGAVTAKTKIEHRWEESDRNEQGTLVRFRMSRIKPPVSVKRPTGPIAADLHDLDDLVWGTGGISNDDDAPDGGPPGTSDAGDTLDQSPDLISDTTALDAPQPVSVGFGASKDESDPRIDEFIAAQIEEFAAELSEETSDAAGGRSFWKSSAVLGMEDEFAELWNVRIRSRLEKFNIRNPGKAELKKVRKSVARAIRSAYFENELPQIAADETRKTLARLTSDEGIPEGVTAEHPLISATKDVIKGRAQEQALAGLRLKEDQVVFNDLPGWIEIAIRIDSLVDEHFNVDFDGERSAGFGVSLVKPDPAFDELIQMLGFDRLGREERDQIYGIIAARPDYPESLLGYAMSDRMGRRNAAFKQRAIAILRRLSLDHKFPAGERRTTNDLARVYENARGDFGKIMTAGGQDSIRNHLIRLVALEGARSISSFMDLLDRLDIKGKTELTRFLLDTAKYAGDHFSDVDKAPVVRSKLRSFLQAVFSNEKLRHRMSGALGEEIAPPEIRDALMEVHRASLVVHEPPPLEKRVPGLARPIRRTAAPSARRPRMPAGFGVRSPGRLRLAGAAGLLGIGSMFLPGVKAENRGPAAAREAARSVAASGAAGLGSSTTHAMATAIGYNDPLVRGDVRSVSRLQIYFPIARDFIEDMHAHFSPDYFLQFFGKPYAQVTAGDVRQIAMLLLWTEVHESDEYKATRVYGNLSNAVSQAQLIPNVIEEIWRKYPGTIKVLARLDDSFKKPASKGEWENVLKRDDRLRLTLAFMVYYDHLLGRVKNSKDRMRQIPFADRYPGNPDDVVAAWAVLYHTSATDRQKRQFRSRMDEYKPDADEAFFRYFLDNEVLRFADNLYERVDAETGVPFWRNAAVLRLRDLYKDFIVRELAAVGIENPAPQGLNAVLETFEQVSRARYRDEMIPYFSGGEIDLFIRDWGAFLPDPSHFPPPGRMAEWITTRVSHRMFRDVISDEARLSGTTRFYYSVWPGMERATRGFVNGELVSFARFIDESGFLRDVRNNAFFWKNPRMLIFSELYEQFLLSAPDDLWPDDTARERNRLVVDAYATAAKTLFVDEILADFIQDEAHKLRSELQADANEPVSEDLRDVILSTLLSRVRNRVLESAFPGGARLEGPLWSDSIWGKIEFEARLFAANVVDQFTFSEPAANLAVETESPNDDEEPWPTQDVILWTLAGLSGLVASVTLAMSAARQVSRRHDHTQPRGFGGYDDGARAFQQFENEVDFAVRKLSKAHRVSRLVGNVDKVRSILSVYPGARFKIVRRRSELRDKRILGSLYEIMVISSSLRKKVPFRENRSLIVNFNTFYRFFGIPVLIRLRQYMNIDAAFKKAYQDGNLPYIQPGRKPPELEQIVIARKPFQHLFGRSSMVILEGVYSPFRDKGIDLIVAADVARISDKFSASRVSDGRELEGAVLGGRSGINGITLLHHGIKTVYSYNNDLRETENTVRNAGLTNVRQRLIAVAGDPETVTTDPDGRWAKFSSSSQLFDVIVFEVPDLTNDSRRVAQDKDVSMTVFEFRRLMDLIYGRLRPDGIAIIHTLYSDAKTRESVDDIIAQSGFTSQASWGPQGPPEGIVRYTFTLRKGLRALRAHARNGLPDHLETAETVKPDLNAPDGQGFGTNEFMNRADDRGSGEVKKRRIPLLLPDDKWWRNKAATSAAEFRLNGRTFYVFMGIGSDNKGRFGLAESWDDYQINKVLDEPIFESEEENPEEVMGVENPRITVIGGRIYMIYTARKSFRDFGMALASISVEDFNNENWNAWVRHKEAFTGLGVKDRNAAIFPKPVDVPGAGLKYVMYYRKKPNLRMAYADRSEGPWEDAGIELDVRPPGPPGSHLWVGVSGPPLETVYGWLTFYHYVDKNRTYRQSFFISDHDDPGKIIYNHPYPVWTIGKLENDVRKRFKLDRFFPSTITRILRFLNRHIRPSIYGYLAVPDIALKFGEFVADPGMLHSGGAVPLYDDEVLGPGDRVRLSAGPFGLYLAGATFSIPLLRRRDFTDNAPRGQEVNAALLKDKQFLIVEDNPELRRQIESQLWIAGVPQDKITIPKTAAELTEIMKQVQAGQQDFEVIILDNDINEGDGWKDNSVAYGHELLSTLRRGRAFGGPIVIYYSGQNNVGEEAYRKLRGAPHFLKGDTGQIGERVVDPHTLVRWRIPELIRQREWVLKNTRFVSSEGILAEAERRLGTNVRATYKLFPGEHLPLQEIRYVNGAYVLVYAAEPLTEGAASETSYAFFVHENGKSVLRINDGAHAKARFVKPENHSRPFKGTGSFTFGSDDDHNRFWFGEGAKVLYRVRKELEEKPGSIELPGGEKQLIAELDLKEFAEGVAAHFESFIQDGGLRDVEHSAAMLKFNLDLGRSMDTNTDVILSVDLERSETDDKTVILNGIRISGLEEKLSREVLTAFLMNHLHPWLLMRHFRYVVVPNVYGDMKETYENARYLAGPPMSEAEEDADAAVTRSTVPSGLEGVRRLNPMHTDLTAFGFGSKSKKKDKGAKQKGGRAKLDLSATAEGRVVKALLSANDDPENLLYNFLADRSLTYFLHFDLPALHIEHDGAAKGNDASKVAAGTAIPFDEQNQSRFAAVDGFFQAEGLSSTYHKEVKRVLDVARSYEYDEYRVYTAVRLLNELHRMGWPEGWDEDVTDVVGEFDETRVSETLKFMAASVRDGIKLKPEVADAFKRFSFYTNRKHDLLLLGRLAKVLSRSGKIKEMLETDKDGFGWSTRFSRWSIEPESFPRDLAEILHKLNNLFQEPGVQESPPLKDVRPTELAIAVNNYGPEIFNRFGFSFDAETRDAIGAVALGLFRGVGFGARPDEAAIREIDDVVRLAPNVAGLITFDRERAAKILTDMKFRGVPAVRDDLERELITALRARERALIARLGGPDGLSALAREIVSDPAWTVEYLSDTLANLGIVTDENTLSGFTLVANRIRFALERHVLRQSFTHYALSDAERRDIEQRLDEMASENPAALARAEDALLERFGTIMPEADTSDRRAMVAYWDDMMPRTLGGMIDFVDRVAGPDGKLYHYYSITHDHVRNLLARRGDTDSGVVQQLSFVARALRSRQAHDVLDLGMLKRDLGTSGGALVISNPGLMGEGVERFLSGRIVLSPEGRDYYEREGLGTLAVMLDRAVKIMSIQSGTENESLFKQLEDLGFSFTQYGAGSMVIKVDIARYVETLGIAYQAAAMSA